MGSKDDFGCPVQETEAPIYSLLYVEERPFIFKRPLVNISEALKSSIITGN